MSSKLYFQRTLAVLIGVMLLAFVLFLTSAIVAYRPMASALLETDQKWIAIQDAEKARILACESLLSELGPNGKAAASEFRRAADVYGKLPVDREISPFNVDRAGDFDRAEKILRDAVAGLISDAAPTNPAAKERLTAADAVVRDAIKTYNQSVVSYNRIVRQFPQRLVSQTFSFTEKPLLAP